MDSGTLEKSRVLTVFVFCFLVSRSRCVQRGQTKKRRNFQFFLRRTPLPFPNHWPSALAFGLSLRRSLSLSLSLKGIDFSIQMLSFHFRAAYCVRRWLHVKGLCMSGDGGLHALANRPSQFLLRDSRLSLVPHLRYNDLRESTAFMVSLDICHTPGHEPSSQ